MGKKGEDTKKRASSAAAEKPSKKKKDAVDVTAEEETETMGGTTKEAIQGVINVLKYRADPNKNKKGKELEESQKLLGRYRGIKSTEDRANFIQKFQELGIVKLHDKLGLQDQAEDYDDKQEKVNVHHRNWRYIFKAEGLDPKDYDGGEAEGGDLDEMLNKLLDRNAKENGYTKGMKEGDDKETDRDLVRWLYVDNKGTDFSKGHRNSQTIKKKGETDLTTAQEQRALEGVKKNAVSIKLEFQAYNKLVLKLNVIKSGKARIVGLKNKIEEIKVGLKIKAARDKAYQSKVDSTQETLDKITIFVDKITENVLTWGAVTKDDKIEEGVYDVMDNKVKDMDNFCTALQEFKKEMTKAL